MSEILATKSFFDAEELRLALGEMLQPNQIAFVMGRNKDGVFTFSRATLEQERLTDGSTVVNIYLD